MGGFGSGRRDGIPTVEGCGSIVLAIGKLLEIGKGHSTFTVTYSGKLGGHPYSVAVAVMFGPDQRGTLTITHAAFEHLSAPVPAASYTVQMMSVPWQFCGRRWFILCPRSGRRVLKLYLPNGAHRFAGREAMGLAYQSQRLDSIQSGHARLARAFAKLGVGYHSLHQPIPARPKWMRVATYERLVGRIEAATGRHRKICAEKLKRIIEAENRAFAEAIESGRERRG